MAAARGELFVPKKFLSHSGIPLSWKIECDALSDDELGVLASAAYLDLHLTFGKVLGVPTGGERFAEKLRLFESPISKKVLIVDDVLTTGKSMEQEKWQLASKGLHGLHEIEGLVIFARSTPPPWVKALFRYGAR